MSRAPVRFEVVGRRVAEGAAATDDFTYQVIEPVVAAAAKSERASQKERRTDRRIASRLREGVVGERRTRAIVGCRIRDLSRSGARLQLDRERPLPRSFLLTEPAAHRYFWATLVWQVGRDAGVRLREVDEPRG